MKTIIRFSILFSIFLNSPVFAQGSLEPAAPPGPTMKTLDQVEPRTPISEAQAIEASGSYYLTNNISGGIGISADNVDLDLNGFTLSDGVPNGVDVDGRSNIKIYNGTIQNPETAGVGGGTVADVHLENLRISGGVSCVNFFLPVGLVKVSRISCRLATAAGINVASNTDEPIIAVIHDNVVSFAGSNTDVPRAGIRIVHGGSGGTYVDVRNNQVFANGATGIGIAAGGDGTAGTITGNTTNFNGGNGLFVIGDFVVTKNISQGNDEANFNFDSAPNAAPVTGINDSPGPWHNITDTTPAVPD